MHMVTPNAYIAHLYGNEHRRYFMMG